jgi:hypothetical protein
VQIVFLSKLNLQYDKFAQGTTFANHHPVFVCFIGDIQAALFQPVPNDCGGSLGDALPMEVRPFKRDSSVTVDKNGS